MKIFTVKIRAKSFLLLIVLLCIGCAWKPGQIPDSDFHWQENIITADYQEVYRRITQGFRTCDDHIAEGNIFTDTKSGYLDIYAPNIFQEKSAWVVGRIEIKANNDNTIVRIGVQSKYDWGWQQGKRHSVWLKYAEGHLPFKENG